MKRIKSYEIFSEQIITEHKFWGKSISDLLEWIKLKSDKHFILIDTETTGLPSDPYEIQLTQVSCIVTKYNYNLNKFNEINTYNKKIKLTTDTLKTMSGGESRIKNVLSFNRYGQSGKFHDEDDVLFDFLEFINQYDDPVFVIQNAEFDMRFLNTRNRSVRFKNEVIDTKQIIQLFYLPAVQKLSETDPKYMDMVNKIGTSDRDNGLVSSSLSKIGPALGINMVGYHDALVDCRLMMQTFEKIVDFLKKNQNLDIKSYQEQRIMTKK